jgi:hypothetical protein
MDSKNDSKKELTTPPSDETGLYDLPILPPEAFADEGFGSDRLMFDGKRGVWSMGKETVPIGTKVVVMMDQLMKGFIRFDDGMPTTQLLPQGATQADLYTLRQSLGDLDQSLWERSKKGKPIDPWRQARELPVILLVRTLDTVVFSTSSQGGLHAVSALKRAVMGERRDPSCPTALPIVSLDADSYKHPEKEYGTIYTPLLDIDRWTTHQAVKKMMHNGTAADLLADTAGEDHLIGSAAGKDKPVADADLPLK